jgi:hypothetical protein
MDANVDADAGSRLSGWFGCFDSTQASGLPQETEVQRCHLGTGNAGLVAARQSGRRSDKDLASGQERESRRQLHQLKHFVNIDVDAAQHDLDGFIVGCTG